MKDMVAGLRDSTDDAGSSREASDTAGSGLQSRNDSSQQPFRGVPPRRGSEDPRADDRIKSRAVNDLGWNWEAERAKMETGGLSASSSMLRGVSEGGPSNAPPTTTNGATADKAFVSHLNSNMTHTEQVSSPTGESSRGVVSPRTSSKVAVYPPRIDTSGNSNTPSNLSQSTRSSQQEPAQPLSSIADTFSSDAVSQGGSSQRLQSRKPQHQMSSSSSKEKGGRRDQTCDACGKPMTGQFVRALGVVFHLDCFRCRVSEKGVGV